MDYFGIPSLEAHDTMPKRRSSPAASVVDDGQACSAAAAIADNPDDVDNCWDLEDAVGLGDVERVESKCHLGDPHDRCCAKKRKALGTVAEMFKLATKLVNQEASTSAGV